MCLYICVYTQIHTNTFTHTHIQCVNAHKRSMCQHAHTHTRAVSTRLLRTPHASLRQTLHTHTHTHTDMKSHSTDKTPLHPSSCVNAWDTTTHSRPPTLLYTPET